VIVRVHLQLSYSPTHKKVKSSKAGLCNDWNQPYFEDPVLTQAPSRRSLSTSSGKSYVSMTSSKPTTMASAGDDSDADVIGGISDDEGDYLERNGLTEKAKAIRYYGGRNTSGEAKVSDPTSIIFLTESIDHLQIKSLAKIAPTPSILGYIPPHNGSRSRSRGPLKKDKIQLSHLPSEIQQHFAQFSLHDFVKSLRSHHLGSHLARMTYANFGLKLSVMLLTAKRWNLWCSSW
jgi:hypothetical protein